MGSWDDLPSDLLLQIAERIPQHTDLLSFGALCRLSRTSLMGNLHRLPNKLPLSCCLPSERPIPMLLWCSHDEEHDVTLEFFSVPDERTYSGFLIPEIANRWIVGSSNGWLVTVEIYGRQIHLLNPLTRAQLCLPSLSAFEHPRGGFQEGDYDDFTFIEKATILEEPCRSGRESDWTVMALISCFSVLSYCKRGDTKWTNVKGSPIHIVDVIAYRGQFYAVVDSGQLVACDVANGMKMTSIAWSSDGTHGKRYLVESSSGDLLQVVRVMDWEEPSKTIDFMVFKLVVVHESKTDIIIRRPIGYQTIEGKAVWPQEVGFGWIELKHIDDQLLFVGCNRAVALPAQQYKCMGNCIYFTDDRLEQQDIVLGISMWDKLPYDMGIFDMEDRSIKPFEGMRESMHVTVPPVWIVPNPW